MVRGLSKDGLIRLAKKGLSSGAVLHVEYPSSEDRQTVAKIAFDKGYSRLYNLILEINVVAYLFDDPRDAFSLAKSIRKKTNLNPDVYKAGNL